MPNPHADECDVVANMLTVAVYAILRFKAVTDRTVGPEFAGKLIVGLALLSLAVSAIFLLVQRDYKRLFAYSSIEHIGIALLGFGVGGLGVFGGAWHLMNHALAKSTAFYGSGLVFLRYNHKSLDRVTGCCVDAGRRDRGLVAGVACGMPPDSLPAKC
jgi:hydrogenase-4 component F